MSKTESTGKPSTSDKKAKHKGDHAAAQPAGDTLAINGGPAADHAEWTERLLPRLKTFGTYSLYILGAYWIAAAWLSTWGASFWGCVWWTFVGIVLIYAGMISQAETAPKEVVREVGRNNIRYGGIIFFCGLALTAITWKLAVSSGGYYLIFWAPMFFGALQSLHGLGQTSGVVRVRIGTVSGGSATRETRHPSGR